MLDNHWTKGGAGDMRDMVVQMKGKRISSLTVIRRAKITCANSKLAGGDRPQCRRKGEAHDNKRPAALVGCYALCAALGQNIKLFCKPRFAALSCYLSVLLGAL